MRLARNGFFWMALAFGALVLLMPYFKPVFAVLFPRLDRPLFEQTSFLRLALSHLMLVGASSLAAMVIGVGAGIFVTRPSGAEFRATVETLVAMGQTVPPVAVLALAVPLTGFGAVPALIALTLYGVLPILQNTIAGLAAVPSAAREAAQGMGMSPAGLLRQVELPLALPVVLAGIRTSVVINVGTATIASTVGAETLGMPIIVGLNGSNTAYVIQGALLVALLGIALDLGLGRLAALSVRWRTAT